MYSKLPLLFLLFISLRSFCQDAETFKPDSIKKELNAVAIKTMLHIDGIFNEPEWNLAKSSPDFIQIEPYQGQVSNFRTDVKVLYNQSYLYLGIFSHDSLGRKAVRSTDFKRDFDYRQHDLINFAFDGFNDKRNAMCFAVNAYGVQRDYLSFDDLYFDENWDGLWRVRTTRTDSGWYAEIADSVANASLPQNKGQYSGLGNECLPEQATYK
jgi:hypothetical protein